MGALHRYPRRNGSLRVCDLCDRVPGWVSITLGEGKGGGGGWVCVGSLTSRGYAARLALPFPLSDSSQLHTAHSLFTVHQTPESDRSRMPREAMEKWRTWRAGSASAHWPHFESFLRAPIPSGWRTKRRTACSATSSLLSFASFDGMLHRIARGGNIQGQSHGGFFLLVLSSSALIIGGLWRLSTGNTLR